MGDADLFDAEFFGFSPRYADMMDPQQRIFMEVAWDALEAAGYITPTITDGRVGVLAGAGRSTYLATAACNAFADVPALKLQLGTDKDYLCTRVAYKLNLQGPAVTVQTACSTSLVAVHVACRSLLTSECEMA